jgi:hypothetical protein
MNSDYFSEAMKKKAEIENMTGQFPKYREKDRDAELSLILSYEFK